MKLQEAITALLDATVDTGIDINISSDGIVIHWNGVNRLECNATNAARVLPMLKNLEKFGMKDC